MSSLKNSHQYHPSYTSVPGKLYAWGSGEPDYAIPNAAFLRDVQKHLPFPVRIQNFNPRSRTHQHIKEGSNKQKSNKTNELLFHQICADTGGVFAALDNKGRAIVWGNSQRYGFPESAHAGYQLAKNEELSFQLLAVGENFVVGITKEEGKDGGRLMEWKALKKSKEMSHKGGFMKVSELIGKDVVDVAACGHAVLAVVLEENMGSLPDSVERKRTLYMRFSGPSTTSVYLEYLNKFSVVEELVGKNINLISVGSTVRACVDDENVLYTWGSNRNGALGLGKRTKRDINIPTKVCFPSQFGDSKILSIDCTRGQPNPKNNLPNPTGQEGPRIHLVTDEGSLWIAGTCHKGLGADHIGKIMTSSGDHLEFYRVGGLARDIKHDDEHKVENVCLSGALHSMSFDEYRKIFVRKDVSNLNRETMQALKDCGIEDSSFNEIKEQKAITSKGKCDTLKKETSGAAKNTSHIMTNYLSDVSIVASVTSHIHSFALSSDGALFGFGCGSNGRLGIPYFFKKDGSKRLMKCYVSSPSRVQLSASQQQEEGKVGKLSITNEDVQVLAVSVGKYWSFAITR